jgi:hypothetical protein
MALTAQKSGSITATSTVSLGDTSPGAVGYWVIQFTGDFDGDVDLGGSVNGTDYVDVAFVSASTTTPGTHIVSLTFTSGDMNGIYIVDAKGLADLRIDATVTSGTLTYSARPVIG